MANPNSVAEAVALLGVAPGADAAAVRKRYRELAKQLHPDRNPDDPLADQRMAELNRARDLLVDGVPRDLQRGAPASPPPQPEPQRRPQSRAERAETHQAFRDEMERARRTDTERERRRRAARRRVRQEAEERARRAAEAAREAADQPPPTEPTERRRRRPSGQARTGASKTAAPKRRGAARARNAPPKSDAFTSPIGRICDLLSAQGWEDAVAAVRQRYREAGASAPQSAEFVLSVELDGAARVAAVVVAAPGVLDGAALDYAIGRAAEVGAPFAFAANERMFRRAGVRSRARTNPKTLSKFPKPDELSEALAQQIAEAEAEDGSSKRERGPANFGRLFRR